MSPNRKGEIPMSTTQASALDLNKLNAFIGQFVTDLGASVHAGMVVIGEKLGLYKALATGPMSSAELASRTQTDERYLREWLASQAAGGYITYDEHTNRFGLSVEQSLRWQMKTARPICPAHLNWRWVHWPQFRGSPTPSGTVPEWVGTNMWMTSSMAAKSSSVQVTPPIL
jgi:hypothetical protein